MSTYMESASDVVYGCLRTATFKESDWIGLALAALDQAGISPAQLAEAYRHANGDTKRTIDELTPTVTVPILRRNRVMLDAVGEDDEIVYFDCFADPSVRWNGFACPFFTKEQAEIVARSLESCGVIQSWWWGKDDDILEMLGPEYDRETNLEDVEAWEPVDRLIEGGPDGSHSERLWCIGGWAWTWLFQADIDRMARKVEG